MAETSIRRTGQAPAGSARPDNGRKPKEPLRPPDAWLVWFPTYRCIFNCEYCFFLNPIKRTAPAEPIDIPGLVASLDGSGRTVRLSFGGGGEPFLIPNLVEACQAVTRSHYIAFTTNLVSKNIPRFAEVIDPARVGWLIASLHIKELERLRLVDRYVRHYKLCAERGFPISPDAIAYPPLRPEADRYRDMFRRLGVPLKFSPFIGMHDGRFYPDSYTDEDVALFGLDPEVRTTYHSRKKLCNAGFNMGVVNQRGDVWPCWKIPEKLGTITEGFAFRRDLVRCPFDFCGFPFTHFDPENFDRAQRESGGRVRPARSLWRYGARASLMEIWGRMPAPLRKTVARIRRKRGL